MKCVVTGAAGFIGSHLCEGLLGLGHEVVGLDAFVAYYPRAVKEGNLTLCRAHPRFRFERCDLRSDPLDEVLDGADVVFHLAAQAGLTQSWIDFDTYATCNVQATQRLLESLRRALPRPRLVHASTSSVYGEFASGDETLPTRPVSPYGVTKLAAEHLCRAYGETYGIPVVVLRYFSVYGPRQRPDMGYHRFIRGLLADEPVSVYGDGQQVRGNTYVADCVAATVAAAEARPGEVYNVGGGEAASVWDILRMLEELVGRPARVKQEPARNGDQRHTFADTAKLYGHLGWRPGTTLRDGLARQWQWQQRELRAAAPAHGPGSLREPLAPTVR
jgi:nucleoside-diphosphate-sugar epimerase